MGLGGRRGTFLLLAGIISAAVIHAGHGALLLVFTIGMAIILPVSIVILVISMFIASALLGGIDFGQAHVAIPKAGALLFVVNLLSMIPIVGAFLALPVWFLGLMGLFGSDFVEARILVAINWCLNTLFKYFVLAAILSGILHSGSSDGPRPIKVPSGEAAAVKKIEALGGHCDSDDDEDDGGHITEVVLENTSFDDSSVSLLRSFPKLHALSLANTRVTDQGLRDVATLSSLEHLDLSGDAGVTDAGLDHLAGLPKLHVILLARTRVTEGGIQKLRRSSGAAGSALKSRDAIAASARAYALSWNGVEAHTITSRVWAERRRRSGPRRRGAVRPRRAATRPSSTDHRD